MQNQKVLLQNSARMKSKYTKKRLEKVLTSHKDLTQRLKKSNRTLYYGVRKVLELNKEERHLRGGMATRHKYHPDQL